MNHYFLQKTESTACLFSEVVTKTQECWGRTIARTNCQAKSHSETVKHAQTHQLVLYEAFRMRMKRIQWYHYEDPILFLRTIPSNQLTKRKYA